MQLGARDKVEGQAVLLSAVAAGGAAQAATTYTHRHYTHIQYQVPGRDLITDQILHAQSGASQH